MRQIDGGPMFTLAWMLYICFGIMAIPSGIITLKENVWRALGIFALGLICGGYGIYLAAFFTGGYYFAPRIIFVFPVLLIIGILRALWTKRKEDRAAKQAAWHQAAIARAQQQGRPAYWPQPGQPAGAYAPQMAAGHWPQQQGRPAPWPQQGQPQNAWPPQAPGQYPQPGQPTAQPGGQYAPPAQYPPAAHHAPPAQYAPAAQYSRPDPYAPQRQYAQAAQPQPGSYGQPDSRYQEPAQVQQPSYQAAAYPPPVQYPDATGYEAPGRHSRSDQRRSPYPEYSEYTEYPPQR